MAFVRDHGTCCIILPLKLGVGLIAMFTFAMGMLCIVDCFNSAVSSFNNQLNISMSAGGYNPYFWRLNSVVGVIGLFVGFIGFLGVYDDKPDWCRIFSGFLVVKLLCNIIVFIADMYTLRTCESFAGTALNSGNGFGTATYNLALIALAKQNMCQFGRISYAVGFSLRTAIDLYFLWNVYKYVSQLDLNPPYPIDFGDERMDVEGRWKFFHVQPAEGLPLYMKKEAKDLMKERGTGEKNWKKAYGTDGFKGSEPYGPDGMHGPAYIRAAR
mmetsp:Transcript_76881/g.136248  ORF Transcript_76881/g.136248 Transcript_76881/m.136248 type:complete len:270 (-) Transcript_76881:41-850(-)